MTPPFPYLTVIPTPTATASFLLNFHFILIATIAPAIIEEVLKVLEESEDVENGEARGEASGVDQVEFDPRGLRYE